MGKYEDGNATQLAFDKFFELPEDDNVPAIEYIQNLDEVTVFKDACVKKILSLSPELDVSDNEKIINFMLQAFKEKNIEAEEKTIRRWIIKTKDIPESYNRETVYKICFALSMNEKEAEEFFLKGYLERAFNFKNINESVYYFCLKNGLPYSEAQEIINEIEQKDDIDNPNADSISAIIAVNIDSIQDKNELIDYIVKNRSGFVRQNTTAIEIIKKLLPKCYEVATLDNTFEKNALNMDKKKQEKNNNDENGKNKKNTENTETNKTYPVTNEDELLAVIYGYSARATENRENVFQRSISDKNASKFPLLIKRNFPQREQLKNLLNGKASNDVIRKALIMFNFYYFFAEAKFGSEANKKSSKEISEYENGAFDEFVDEMNGILEECGFVQLYWRNPFDWFIGYCAEATNPLYRLKDIIYDLYLSNDEIYIKK